MTFPVYGQEKDSIHIKLNPNNIVEGKKNLNFFDLSLRINEKNLS